MKEKIRKLIREDCVGRSVVLKANVSVSAWQSHQPSAGAHLRSRFQTHFFPLFLHQLLAFNLHLTVGHHNNKGKLMANRMKMKPTGEGKHLLTNLITTARPFLFHVITH